MKTISLAIIALVLSFLSLSSKASQTTIFLELGDQNASSLIKTTSPLVVGTQSISTLAADDFVVPNRTMPPSIITSNVLPGEQKIDIDLVCTFFYVPIPDCDITVNDPLPDSLSGGHDHDNSVRPGGTVYPMHVNTGSAYVATVTYTAPEVSGIIRLNGTGTSPVYGSTRAQYIIKVAVPTSLISLPSSLYYDLAGQCGTTSPNGNPVLSEHCSNHYGTSSIVTSILNLANDYNFATEEKLKINDISLKWGGLFDIDNNWAFPHKNHRFGQNADVSTVGVKNRGLLKFLAKAADLTVTGVYSSHYHMSR